jgi:hypothetical protein
MKRKFLTTTALICCFMICLAAKVADINGSWAGTVRAPDGNDYPLSYVFKAEGDKLTGTAKGPQGETELANGKVNGTEFSFSISVDGNDVPHTCKYYADGDSIAVNIDYSGSKLHSTLKRAEKTDK